MSREPQKQNESVLTQRAKRRRGERRGFILPLRPLRLLSALRVRNLQAKEQHGFALLEVLIAFAIAAMALALLFQAAGTSGSAARSAGYYEEAVSRAKSRMAMLGRATPLSEGESEGEDDGGAYRWRVRVTPSATAEPPRGTLPTANHTTLYDVEVAISWTDDRRKHEVVLHSQRLGVRSGAGDG